MLQWLTDTYTIQAGDASAGYCGRGYNMQTRQWETITGTNMGRSVMTRYRLRAFHVWPYTATGQPKTGVMFQLAIVGDPTNTGFTIWLPWRDKDKAGGSSLTSFVGDFPMCAGVIWRCRLGGLIATDYVNVSVGYE